MFSPFQNEETFSFFHSRTQCSLLRLIMIRKRTLNGRNIRLVEKLFAPTLIEIGENERQNERERERESRFKKVVNKTLRPCKSPVQFIHQM